MSDGDITGRLFSADGVQVVRFRREGAELVNVDEISLRPGDFLDLGPVGGGTFTLELQAAPAPPSIVEWFYGPGPIDGL